MRRLKSKYFLALSCFSIPKSKQIRIITSSRVLVGEAGGCSPRTVIYQRREDPLPCVAAEVFQKKKEYFLKTIFNENICHVDLVLNYLYIYIYINILNTPYF